MTTPSTQTIPEIPGLPLVGSFLPFRNDRLNFFLRIGRECPDIGMFHLGPMRVLLPTSPRVLQSIMVSQADDFQGGLNSQLEPLLGKDSLFNVFGERHRQQRKLIAPSLQPRTVALFANTMVDYTNDAMDRLVDGSVISVPEMLTALTMRIIGKVMFGKDMEESRELADAIKTGIDHVEYLMSSMLPIPLTWPTPRSRKTRRALDTIQREVKTMLAERRASAPSDKDMLSLLFSFRDEDGQGLTDEQLRDQTVTLFLAGHETTALTLGWTWHLLLENPDAYARLQAEVDSVLGSRPPTLEDLPRLAYTLQVVKESMRMYPSAYLAARSPRHDVTVQGYPLRKGDLILLTSYVLHHNPDFYEQPEKFIPERFSPENEKARPRGQYMPFGAGAKICPGNHFAMQEAHLLMAVMVQRLRFEALPGHKVTAITGPSLRVSDYQARVHLRRAAQAPQTVTAHG